MIIQTPNEKEALIGRLTSATKIESIKYSSTKNGRQLAIIEARIAEIIGLRKALIDGGPITFMSVSA